MITRRHYLVSYVVLICTIELLYAYTSKNDLSGKKTSNSTTKNQAAKKNTFFRLTAAKLIVMILAVIFSGAFIYYFFLFYPILCKKERNYDVVEHSRDTTPSPNTEKN